MKFNHVCRCRTTRRFLCFLLDFSHLQQRGNETEERPKNWQNHNESEVGNVGGKIYFWWSYPLSSIYTGLWQILSVINQTYTLRQTVIDCHLVRQRSSAMRKLHTWRTFPSFRCNLHAHTLSCIAGTIGCVLCILEEKNRQHNVCRNVWTERNKWNLCPEWNKPRLRQIMPLSCWSYDLSEKMSKENIKKVAPIANSDIWR